jgi:hypothetical protein
MPGSKVGTTGGCLGGQTCVAGSKTGQFVCVDGSGSGTGNGDGGGGKGDGGGGGNADATMSDDSTHDGSGTDATSSCPNSTTQFGKAALGDPNPNFTSGVGARTTNDLFIFDGYNGPDPAGDGGGSPVALVYVQDFDAKTAKSKGPAKRLFAAPTLGVNGYGTTQSVLLDSAAVAPTGEMALVYDINFMSTNNAFYAAFLGPSADAGSASDGGVDGLEVENVVLLASSDLNSSVKNPGSGGGGSGQPWVIWSDTIQAFVISWEYIASNNYVQVGNFLPGGGTAGGGAQPVPTDDNGQNEHGSGYEQNGSTGESRNLFGVGYVDLANTNPALTILDSLGNQVGSSFDVVPPLPKVNSQWVAVAGTSNGFVYFYDNTQPDSVSEVFVPLSADGGVVGALLDGGGGSDFKTFSFTGAMRATAGRAIADGPGGAGGVGIALLYPNGVSYAYVDANGVGHEGPTTLFAHTVLGSDEVAMTNFAGSFVVSLYDSTAHSTQAAASGCQ